MMGELRVEPRIHFVVECRDANGKLKWIEGRQPTEAELEEMKEKPTDGGNRND